MQDQHSEQQQPQEGRAKLNQAAPASAQTMPEQTGVSPSKRALRHRLDVGHKAAIPAPGAGTFLLHAVLQAE